MDSKRNQTEHLLTSIYEAKEKSQVNNTNDWAKRHAEYAASLDAGRLLKKKIASRLIDSDMDFTILRESVQFACEIGGIVDVSITTYEETTKNIFDIVNAGLEHDYLQSKAKLKNVTKL